MATRSSVLAWKIPWTEEPGRRQSMGSQRVRCKRTCTYTHTQWIMCTEFPLAFDLKMTSWDDYDDKIEIGMIKMRYTVLMMLLYKPSLYPLQTPNARINNSSTYARITKAVNINNSFTLKMICKMGTIYALLQIPVLKWFGWMGYAFPSKILASSRG